MFFFQSCSSHTYASLLIWQLEDLQTEHAKVLKQNDSLGARLINLQVAQQIYFHVVCRGRESLYGLLLFYPQRKLEYQENKTHPLPASAPDLSLKKASKPVALKAKVRLHLR